MDRDPNSTLLQQNIDDAEYSKSAIQICILNFCNNKHTHNEYFTVKGV